MRTEVELIGEGHSAESLIATVFQYKKKELLCKVVTALFLSTKETLKKDWLFLFSKVTQMGIVPCQKYDPWFSRSRNSLLGDNLENQTLKYLLVRDLHMSGIKYYQLKIA